MSKEYGKFISETSIDTSVPLKIHYNGRLYIGDLTEFPEIMDYLGFKEIVSEEEYPEQKDGFYVEEWYSEDETKISRHYRYVEEPLPEPLNRSISKRKLMNNLKAMNLWTSVKQLMESNDYIDDWNASTTLDEQDPLLQGAISAVKQMAGLSDNDIDNLIENSLAEY